MNAKERGRGGANGLSSSRIAVVRIRTLKMIEKIWKKKKFPSATRWVQDGKKNSTRKSIIITVQKYETCPIAHPTHFFLFFYEFHNSKNKDRFMLHNVSKRMTFTAVSRAHICGSGFRSPTRNERHYFSTLTIIMTLLKPTARAQHGSIQKSRISES